jgi:hypothetical protein
MSDRYIDPQAVPVPLNRVQWLFSARLWMAYSSIEPQAVPVQLNRVQWLFSAASGWPTAPSNHRLYLYS